MNTKGQCLIKHMSVHVHPTDDCTFSEIVVCTIQLDDGREVQFRQYVPAFAARLHFGNVMRLLGDRIQQLWETRQKEEERFPRTCGIDP